MHKFRVNKHLNGNEKFHNKILNQFQETIVSVVIVFLLHPVFSSKMFRIFKLQLSFAMILRQKSRRLLLTV